MKRIGTCEVFVLLLLAGMADRAGAANLMLVGTAVQTDQFSPVPGLEVTLFPDSVLTITDAQGDFLFPWNGAAGWLTFRFPQTSTDPGERGWCKRYAVFPHRAPLADSTVDLGPIMTAVNLPSPSTPIPRLPGNAHPPDTLRVAGPQRGEKDHYAMAVRISTDIWGQVVDVRQVGGEPAPDRLQVDLFKWIRGLTWAVSPHLPCNSTKVLTANEHYPYTWNGSAWVSYVKQDPFKQSAPGLPPPPARSR
jgi:hypothetical protein